MNKGCLIMLNTRNCDFVFAVILLIMCVACGTKNSEKYSLEASDSILTISIDEDTKLPKLSVFPFIDNEGRECLSFQNDTRPEIQIYNIRTGDLIKKVRYDVQGDQGIVGGFCGYYIKDYDHIYVTSIYTNVIYVTDTAAHIKQKILFDKTDQGDRLIPFLSTSFSQIAFKGDSLFIPQTLNKMLRDKIIDDSPICVLIDTTKHLIKSLPMRYLPLVTAADLGTSAMNGTAYSKCFNGNDFIYAFSYTDKLYKVSTNHENRKEVAAKSQFINKLEVPRGPSDDFQRMIKELCESPSYGNIIYDEYRNVYYRFSFPKTELGQEKDYLEILHSGRKQFSVMILDENLNVLGETLFPEFMYNPNLSFVLEDGLYISTSHIKNPTYSDDELSFQRIDLVKH